jgi:hypothetical protein
MTDSASSTRGAALRVVMPISMAKRRGGHRRFGSKDTVTACMGYAFAVKVNLFVNVTD